VGLPPKCSDGSEEKQPSPAFRPLRLSRYLAARDWALIVKRSRHVLCRHVVFLFLMYR